MKLGLGKIINIIVILFVFGVAIIHIYTDDPLKPTRDEIYKFYETGFDHCKITQILQKKFPTNQYMKYDIFYTDCTYISFPVRLNYEKQMTDSELFKKGAVITKQPNSLSVLIEYNGKEYKTLILDPKLEDTRGDGSIAIIIFAVIAISLVIFLPRSLFSAWR